MDVSAFDFELPEDLIAQTPSPRGASRMLVLDRHSGAREHAGVADLPRYLKEGDLLVVNDTKVFPARLIGRREPSGGAVECLLLSRIDETCWDALMHPGQKLKPGAHVVFEGERHRLHAEVVECRFHGRRTVRLWTDAGTDIDEVIDAIGHVPLPPYIKRQDLEADRDRYQTVYARHRGSVAAPTAGLHFTPAMLDALDRRGVRRTAITLHVGYGTFKPVRAEQVEAHQVDSERYSIGESAARDIECARQEGRRVIAVGTTTTRALEAAALAGGGKVIAHAAATDLFIYPGFRFAVVNGLMTNFHLPRSSLLMLVSALAGREHVLAAYREAVALEYRFYSYGDATLIC